MEIDGWMAMPSVSATPGPSSKTIDKTDLLWLNCSDSHETCCTHSIIRREASILPTLQHVYCRSFGDCWCMYFAKGLSNSFHRSMPNYIGRASTNRGSSLGPWWWLQSPRWGNSADLQNRSSCNSPMRNINPALINQGLINPLLLHWRGPSQTHFSRVQPRKKKQNSCFLKSGVEN